MFWGKINKKRAVEMKGLNFRMKLSDSKFSSSFGNIFPRRITRAFLAVSMCGGRYTLGMNKVSSILLYPSQTEGCDFLQGVAKGYEGSANQYSICSCVCFPPNFTRRFPNTEACYWSGLGGQKLRPRHRRSGFWPWGGQWEDGKERLVYLRLNHCACLMQLKHESSGKGGLWQF